MSRTAEAPLPVPRNSALCVESGGSTPGPRGTGTTGVSGDESDSGLPTARHRERSDGINWISGCLRLANCTIFVAFLYGDIERAAITSLHEFASSWSSELGLLPIPFLPNDESLRYVLVNGYSGNFCLDQTEDQDRDTKRGGAWSSNVGHDVSLLGDTVEVLRYDASASVAETYSLQSIQKNLRKFHAYLEDSQPRAEMSVISHAIRVFRQLRSASSDEEGTRSLLSFLTLIACVTDNCDRDSLNWKKWGLHADYGDSLTSINGSDWELLSTELVRGRCLDNLTLRPELLLRHAAGQLFQEAHYEASVIRQLRLAGFPPPSKAPTKINQGIGVHFTPPSLARMVVEQSLSLLDLPSVSSITVFDPACGSGEFLRESIRQLRIGKFTGKINLIGWDISQAACDMASFVLAWEREKMLARSPSKYRV